MWLWVNLKIQVTNRLANQVLHQFIVNHGKPNDEPSPSVAEINGISTSNWVVLSASFLEIGVP